MRDDFFFFNNTATTEIYTLSLHDALPIWEGAGHPLVFDGVDGEAVAVGGETKAEVEGEGVGLGAEEDERGAGCIGRGEEEGHQDRKSTRLNSSHANISYAVFCLKKKNTI